MRRRAAVTGAIALLAALALPSPAWAAPSTQVVQGEVLRLVSVADWDAASSLRPGVPVRWDVVVSAAAPDPGTVTIAVSATGDAPLRLGVALCPTAWQESGCPGGETTLHSDWSIPRDGSEVALADITDTEVARLRLTIALAADQAAGSTEVRVHAHGAGESAVIGPGGDGLATTGPSSVAPWMLGGIVILAAGGALLFAARRRRRREEEEE